MKTLNLGILAHVDAGKTSLTERLLYNSGVIKTLGSVDTGNTQTDSMALERQRGITIKSAVVSFNIGDLKINLIDTPGHPDFIAEVERALSVLDVVVLVISAVEGVQPQTRILMQALIKLRIPTIIFVNKVDRTGARSSELIEEIKHKLFPHVAVMSAVSAIGTPEIQVHDLAENESRIRSEFVVQVGHMQVCPVYYGSATLGVGVAELTRALETYFLPVGNDAKSALSAVVFKIERGRRDEKIVFMRIYAGELRARERIDLHRFDATGAEITVPAKIMALQLFEAGKNVDVNMACAGDIVKVWGLNEAAINDWVGTEPVRMKQSVYFTRPSLEIVVSPVVQSDGPKLYSSLQRISEQDPFVEIRRRPRDNVLSVRICGEVQKEVIADTLKRDYGLEVRFSEMTTICIERPDGVGEAVEIGEKGHPYLGIVGLRVEPAPIGAGVVYRRATNVLGTMPPAFFAAVEETVKETLQEGLYGWQVTDCIVTLMRTGYWPRQSHAHAHFDKSMSSTAGDFRNMTPPALMAALKQAGTMVYEPMNRFEMEVPQAVFSTVMQALVGVEARLTREPVSTGETMHLEGLLPVRRTFEFERIVPDLTGGEGTFISELGEYQVAQGPIPSRLRTDNNPLDREQYLKRITERI